MSKINEYRLTDSGVELSNMKFKKSNWMTTKEWEAKKPKAKYSEEIINALKKLEEKGVIIRLTN